MRGRERWVRSERSRARVRGAGGWRQVARRGEHAKQRGCVLCCSRCETLSEVQLPPDGGGWWQAGTPNQPRLGRWPGGAAQARAESIKARRARLGGSRSVGRRFTRLEGRERRWLWRVFARREACLQLVLRIGEPGCSFWPLQSLTPNPAAATRAKSDSASTAPAARHAIGRNLHPACMCMADVSTPAPHAGHARQDVETSFASTVQPSPDPRVYTHDTATRRAARLPSTRPPDQHTVCFLVVPFSTELVPLDLHRASHEGPQHFRNRDGEVALIPEILHDGRKHPGHGEGGAV